MVSRFRSTEVLVLDRTTHRELTRLRPPGLTAERMSFDALGNTVTENLRYTSQVAWRMIPAPGGGVLVVHQRQQSSRLQANPNPDLPPVYYGGMGFSGDASCGAPIVHTAVTRLRVGHLPQLSTVIEEAVLPVDIATDGTTVAIAAAGNNTDATLDPISQEADQGLLQGDLETIVQPGCGRSGRITAGMFADTDAGQIIAVASGPNGWIAQSRQPAGLFIYSDAFGGHRLVPFGGESVADTGHSHFHRAAGVALACASCHAEGGDDGHTWVFSDVGARRTQTFRGGLTGTEPFHWDGALSAFDDLVDEVMIRRMSHPGLHAEHRAALGAWVDAIPTLPHDEPTDLEAVARGEVLFHDADVACSSCHSGGLLTNNTTVDVGTGADLQVPSLRGIAFRGPFLHNGCAPTLKDRFGPCGGGDDHGNTSSLSDAQIDDLVAYLETL
jgi:mono/diheme cytochrome c family protein